MDWTLEVVVVPVTDVDRAKTFYTEKLGFNADVDTNVGDSFRVVQLTPPGSNCSITIGPLVVDEVPPAADQRMRPHRRDAYSVRQCSNERAASRLTASSSCVSGRPPGGVLRTGTFWAAGTALSLNP